MEKDLEVSKSNETETNILGHEKIGKLIRMFAIPSIISMIVNALYNIVDQIFIGWGVGYLGNGATNIVFPITIIFVSFALMFGDGSSTFLSLKLGEGKKKEASKGVANGIILSIVISVVFTTIVLIFLPQLLNLFGCTPSLESYAKEYGYIIALGLPFMMIGTTINSIVRADGNPKYAMATMVAGAILNIILDPIFIFVFHMGVKGAAIATIISQILSFVLNAIYVRKLKTVTLKDNMKFDFKISRKIAGLGVSSFVTQMSAALIMGLQNNLLTKYGGESVYGAEIPITVLGIVMKINEIINSVILGLAMGAQPIIGYNYGAEKYDRVKKTLKVAIISSVVVSGIAFILFQTIPDKLIILFGSSNDPLYIEFAEISFRIYLMLIVGYAIHMPITIFLQAIGKSAKSAFLSMSRQMLFYLVGMLALGHFFGITGVLFARPVSEVITLVFAIVLLIIELRLFGKNKNQSTALEGNNINVNNNLDKQIIITVAREYGSGGRYVGGLVAKELGIKFYDKELIVKLAEKTGLSEEYIENNEQKKKNISTLSTQNSMVLNNSDELFIKESEIIKEIVDKESCVIIGRCANYILKDKENVIKVFIYNNMENKIKRATKYYNLDEDKAEKEIRKINKERENHYKHYTGGEWNDKANYDICINSDILGVEKTAELICNIAKEKINL